MDGVFDLLLGVVGQIKTHSAQTNLICFSPCQQFGWNKSMGRLATPSLSCPKVSSQS